MTAHLSGLLKALQQKVVGLKYLNVISDNNEDA
jgi:hypothetical protein